MKINEVTRIDEGIFDTMARGGWFGKERQIAATGRELDRRQAAVQSAADQNALNTYKRNLSQALLSSDSILTNDTEVAEYLKNTYFANALRNYKMPATHQRSLDTLYTEFARNYIAGGKKGKLPAEADSIWQIIQSAKLSGAGPGSGNQGRNQGTFPNPPDGEEVDTPRGIYKFTSGKWMKTHKKDPARGPRAPAIPLSPAPVEVPPEAIQELNKLAAQV